MANTHITQEQAEKAADTLEQYAAQQIEDALEQHNIIAEAEQDDGSLFAEGRTIFWEAGTDSIELRGTFSIQELLAIATHVQDWNDEMGTIVPDEV